MKRIVRFALAFVTCFIVTASLSGVAEASTGTSTIGTPSGQCLTASGTKTGSPVVLEQCAQLPSQKWDVGSLGAWTLDGTTERVVITGNLTLALAPSGAAHWTYVNHTLATDGDWLTWAPGDPNPFLSPEQSNNDVWYIFTSVGK